MKKEKLKIDHRFLVKCADAFVLLSKDDQRYYSEHPFKFFKICLETYREFKSSEAVSPSCRRS